MDPNQLKKEVLEAWEKHPRGTVLVASGTLLVSGILQLSPGARIALGGLGIAYAVLRPPPTGGQSLFRRVWAYAT